MAAGAAGHHAFELAAGVGLILQRELGLPQALSVWAIGLPGVAVLSLRRPNWSAGPLALAVGASLAAVATHYTLWPWRVRFGVPYLTDAEGLSPQALLPYNALLLGWGGASVVAACAVPTGSRRWLVVGMLGIVPFRRHAEHHFAWLCRQARSNPAWWNRGVAPGSATGAAMRWSRRLLRAAVTIPHQTAASLPGRVKGLQSIHQMICSRAATRTAPGFRCRLPSPRQVMQFPLPVRGPQ